MTENQVGLSPAGSSELHARKHTDMHTYVRTRDDQTRCLCQERDPTVLQRPAHKAHQRSHQVLHIFGPCPVFHPTCLHLKETPHLDRVSPFLRHSPLIPRRLEPLVDLTVGHRPSPPSLEQPSLVLDGHTGLAGTSKKAPSTHASSQAMSRQEVPSTFTHTARLVP
jgi:hypothetical protein